MPPVFAKRCAAAHKQRESGAPHAGRWISFRNFAILFSAGNGAGKSGSAEGCRCAGSTASGWFFMLVIMVPNVVFAIRCRDGFENKPVELMEQIGRFGCFRKSSVFRALARSIHPSVLFLFSGITSRSAPPVVSALLFAPNIPAILASPKKETRYELCENRSGA